MTSKLLLLGLAAIACHPATDRQGADIVTPAQRAAIADTVGKLTTEFIAAMQTVDADKAASFDSGSPDYSFISEDATVCRTPEICQRLNKEGWQALRIDGDSRHRVKGRRTCSNRRGRNHDRGRVCFSKVGQAARSRQSGVHHSMGARSGWLEDALISSVVRASQDFVIDDQFEDFLIVTRSLPHLATSIGCDDCI